MLLVHFLTRDATFGVLHTHIPFNLALDLLPLDRGPSSAHLLMLILLLTHQLTQTLFNLLFNGPRYHILQALTCVILNT